jgi:hypothetical protein
MHDLMRERQPGSRCFPEIVGVFFSLLCASLIGCRWQGGTDRFVTSPSRTVLPAPAKVGLCSPSDKLPLIEASINGGGPHLYLLDTGTDYLILSRRSLAEVKAQPLATTVVIHSPGGPSFLSTECRVNALRIGSAEFRHLTACSADLSNVEAAMGRELGGVLGIPVFADCRLTIDYPAGQVLLEPSTTRSRPEGQGGSVFALELEPGGIPHLFLDIQGHNVRTKIDSGSSCAFTIPIALLQQLHTNSAPVRAGTGTVGVGNSIPVCAMRLPGSIFLGEHEFVRPIVEVANRGPAVLGHGALKYFRVSIDLRKKEASFTRTEPGPIGPPPPIRHCGFSYERRGDHMLVTGSITDSLSRPNTGSSGPRPDFPSGTTKGEASLRQIGLRQGDEVVAVNGIGSSELSEERLRDLADAHDVLTVDLIRDHVQVSVNVPVTVLIP